MRDAPFLFHFGIAPEARSAALSAHLFAAI
jgi:hypothetical protein